MTKTAIVWGAGGGIGRALVQQLNADGWTTIAIARHAADVGEGAAHVFEADVADPQQVQKAIFAAAMETDTVDLWIYAVGDIVAANVAELDAAGWARILSANLSGAFLATHYSLPLLAENACLVYIGAVSERLRLPGLSAYAAAKAGLEAFGDALRKEERKKQVLIVRPGAVATPFWDKVPMRMPTNAPSAEKVAARILEACQNGEKGMLDLTG